MIEVGMFIFGVACGVMLHYFYQFTRDNYKVLKKMKTLDPMPAQFTEPETIKPKWEPCRDCGVYHTVGYCKGKDETKI